MSNFKAFRSVVCAAFCLLVSGVAPMAQAALEKLDWHSAGDGLILHDTNTDLKWLNVTQTLNLSVNDLMGQPFGNTSYLPLVGT